MVTTVIRGNFSGWVGGNEGWRIEPISLLNLGGIDATAWMALNTFKCNYLRPLHVKGLSFDVFRARNNFRTSQVLTLLSTTSISVQSSIR